MIDFKNIIKLAGNDKLDYLVTIEGHPVWDYKLGGLHTIYLISEDPWQGVEDEYVTLSELRKYIVSCEIPFDLVKFQTEADKELLISFKWNDTNRELILSHY
tara:strand:+ start:1005 stop:1310 length:306 start_codon:yes stop_codon:yes gene_type:complete